MKTNIYPKLLITFFLLVINGATSAYVENVVNGYPNCLACHVNPTGGGVLTDYGRSLSSELMSTIKTKNFQNPYYGLLKNNQHIKWGGQVRTIQTRFENDQIKRGSSFIMQNNVEAAAYVRDFVFVGTVGTREGPKNRTPKKGEFISERHYLLWNTDQTSRVKVGKFRQNYGLNDPNHTRFTKQNLGFGSNTESYQLEYFKIFENGEVVLSTSLGRLDIPQTAQNERNFMGQYTHYLAGKSRLTGNVLLGETSTQRRSLYGINGIMPLFSKKNYLKFQLDYQVSRTLNNAPRADKTHALFGNIILGTKPFDGLWTYFVYEHQQTDLEQSRQTMTTSPGVGINFFPISHVEVQFEHQYRTAHATKDNPDHRSFLVFHLYH